MTRGRSNTRKRTAETAFDGEDAAGEWSNHQPALDASTIAISVTNASESALDTPSVNDIPPLSHFMAGNPTQPSAQPTATRLNLCASFVEIGSENEPSRPLKRRKVQSSIDTSAAISSDAELGSNETFDLSSAISAPNGPDWHARTARQDLSITIPTTEPHIPSSIDSKSIAVAIEPTPTPTTEVNQDGDILAVGSLRQSPGSIPPQDSPYPEYSNEEWARLSRHPHLLQKVNSESWRQEYYAGRKQRGHQISENWSVRTFTRNVPSRFAREAILHGDAVEAKRAQRVDLGQSDGYVGRSIDSKLNRWRRRVTKAQGRKRGKDSRWAFFPTITGKLARQVNGDCYRENTLLLNFGCWLRDAKLWETAKSNDSLRPVEEWWEVCNGADTATECGDETVSGDDERFGWVDEWEEVEGSTEEVDELPQREEEELSDEEDEEEERRALMG